MQKEIVYTPEVLKPVGPYSQAVRAGNFLFCSGQLPLRPEDGSMPEGVEAQTRQALLSLKTLLQAGGATLESVVKTTVFLKDMNDFAAMNAVYAEYFTQHPPARSAVQAARLPKDVLVEIEAIAMVE